MPMAESTENPGRKRDQDGEDNEGQEEEKGQELVLSGGLRGSSPHSRMSCSSFC